MEVTALGLADLAIQVLPHPIGQISDAEMRAITDEAFDEVVFALTNPAQDVARAYHESSAPRSDYTR
jgi:hypothetical protein